MNKIIIVIICITCLIFCNMYVYGAVYKNYFPECSGELFCGIQNFKYNLPIDIRNKLLELANDDTKSKRVVIPEWKAGKTIKTETIHSVYPEVIEWYKNFANEMTKIVGNDLEITPLYLPTTCCVLIYDEENDFINWHFDTNYYEGRFFTVLIPLTKEETCTKFIFKNENEQDTPISITNDNCIIFEGDKVFHMASKLCKNEKRCILSLQYTTNGDISLWNRIIMRIKDIAYIGII